MTAFALRAVVLQLLQERAGQWVALDQLQALTAQPLHRVEHVCAQLVFLGDAHTASVGHFTYFGTRVEGVAPPQIQTPTPSLQRTDP